MSNNSDRLIGYNNETLDTHRLLVSFNKNDFWYNRPVVGVSDNMPILDNCSRNEVYSREWDTNKCNNVSKGDKNQDCIRRELCLNRDYADKVDKLQNNHNGSDQNYLDVKNKYSYGFLQSINLGVGVIGVVYIIYSFYKNRNIV